LPTKKKTLNPLKVASRITNSVLIFSFRLKMNLLKLKIRNLNPARRYHLTKLFPL